MFWLVIAVLILIVGLTLGLLAGYVGGFVDDIIIFIVDILFSTSGQCAVVHVFLVVKHQL